MKPVSLIHHLCLISAASLLLIPAVQANQAVPLPSVAPAKLRDLKQPAKTIKEWLAQSESTPSTAAVQVTGVKLERAENGLDITLETADGKPLQVDATKFRAEGNSLIADIPNAVLALPSAQEFSIDNPTSEIATVRLTQTDASTIRVSVVGTTALPTSDVTLKVGGLAYSLNPEGQTSEEELVVTGAGQRGYRAPNSTTATKTDTPLRDIPQSIQVVPRQVLQDQQVTNLSEALRNVPGVEQVGTGVRGHFTTFNIRGFSATNDVFRDGLKDITTAYVVPDVSGIERIEVLKGPGSVLYGQGSLGGIINLVLKKPLSNPFYSVEFSAGSFNLYRGAIDLSGPLNDSKTILYRLNLAAETTESFLDFYDEQRYFVAPVLTFQLSDRTKLTLQAEYDNRPKKNGQAGLPVIGTILPNPNGKIPHDRNIGEPTDTDNQRAYRVGYDLEHRFSDNWQLRNAFSASVIRRDRNFTNSTALATDNRTLSRAYNNGGDDVKFFNVDTYAVGKFATGSIQHQLVIGFNLNRSDSNIEIPANRRAASLDVFNPVYGQPLGVVTSRINNYNSTDSLGIYVQDQINLAENLKLLLGARFDTFKLIAENKVANTEQDLSDSAFSPRVGIVYQPIQPISLYASYSRAFNPVSGIAFDGNAFQPEKGTQYEIGIKADVTDRLSATLAFFDLTRSNVLTTDPTPGRTGFSVQTGEQRSKGFELNLVGEILPGWNIIAGYAYIDAEITQDNTFAVGNAINLVPKNSFNIWTTYEIPAGPLRGFGVGVGVFFVGDRQGDLANTFELPSYLRTDAAIFYKGDRFRVALNIKNLFNVDYFETATSRLGVFYGDPLTVQGTISWQF